jgi:hypothetical protein
MMMEKVEDRDSNRKLQSDIASDAFLDGYKFAIRHAQDNACDWCLEHDGEVIGILKVVDMKSDHRYGCCTFTFLRAMKNEKKK